MPAISFLLMRFADSFDYAMLSCFAILRRHVTTRRFRFFFFAAAFL